MSGSTSTADDPRHRGTNAWFGLFPAILAGVLVWGAVQAFDPVFEVPKEFHVANIGAPPEKLAAREAAQKRTDRNNAIAYLGAFGGVLALGLGAWQRRMTGAIIATPVGLGFGALAGWLGSWLHARWTQPLAPSEISQSVTVQAVTLAVLGLGVGLAYGLAGRRPAGIALAAVGGAIGGGLAGLLYPVLMSVVMPAVNTAPLIPTESVSRAVWFGLTAALLGLVIPFAAQEKTSGSRTAAQRGG